MNTTAMDADGAGHTAVNPEASTRSGPGPLGRPAADPMLAGAAAGGAGYFGAEPIAVRVVLAVPTVASHTDLRIPGAERAGAGGPQPGNLRQRAARSAHFPKGRCEDRE